MVDKHGPSLVDERRQEALRGYHLLDTPPEAAFDDITAVASEITGMPTSLVTLLDTDRQWFKSMHGFEQQETPLEMSFCVHTILQPDVMLVPDAWDDERFRDNPLVRDEPHIRAYAGAPLVTPHGVPIGALCVIDYEPHALTPRQCAALTSLARQLMKELELRRVLGDFASTITGRRRAETPEALQAILDHAPSLISVKDRQGRFVLVNRSFCALYQVESEDLVGRRADAVLPPAAAEASTRAETEALETGRSVRVEIETLAGGTPRTFSVEKFPLLDWTGAPYAVGTIATDITDRVRYEERLRHLADHDVMTGLPNRSRFREEVGLHLREATRYRVAATVLLIDLDHFKHINDKLGHHGGDQFLVGLTARLQARLRESDLLARLGGDEFAVLLPHTDAAAARLLADDLLTVVRDFRPWIEGQRVASTASIGGCTFGGAVTAQTSTDDVLVWADLAMYQAKDAGRDRAVVPDARPGGPKGSGAGAGDRIREGLARDRFQLYAQPIIDLTTGLTDRYEVLLRLADGDGAVLSPRAFLPAAERFDLVQALDRWVARSAVRLLARLPEEQRRPLSVNVSAKSTADARLLETLHEELTRTQVPPDLLTLEITETAALANFAQAVTFTDGLRQLGCRSALDDFGAGFMSFYYLKHLTVDVVKIDGDFIRDLPDNRVDQLVVECVARVASELGCTTIAEFVQDDRTVDVLTGFDIQYGQGYHFGRPRPVSEVFPAMR